MAAAAHLCTCMLLQTRCSSMAISRACGFSAAVSFPGGRKIVIVEPPRSSAVDVRCLWTALPKLDTSPMSMPNLVAVDGATPEIGMRQDCQAIDVLAARV